MSFPAAYGGNGELRYQVTPGIPGLTLDGVSRLWLGVPEEVLDYAVTLVATDGVGAQALLHFRVEVVAENVGPSFVGGDSLGWQLPESAGAYAPVGKPVEVLNGEGRVLSYTLSGADAVHFVVGVNGQVEVSPETRLDYETRKAYSFVLQISDGKDGYGQPDQKVDDSVVVTVRVVDRDENTFGVRFGSDNQGVMVRDKRYRAGERIAPLRLPAADGGSGSLRYTLSPQVPGLHFDSSTLMLSGTPDYGGIYEMTLRAEDVEGDSGTLGFSIRIVEEERRPEFGDWQRVPDQVYAVGEEIEDLTLPEAGGGDGDLMYRLRPVIPGLMFDRRNRTLSGTPESVGTHQMGYLVEDEDGDLNGLDFNISVLAPETLLDLQGPGVPVDLVATPRGEGMEREVGLTWKAAVDVGRSPVTEYRVQRSSDGLVWTTVENVAAMEDESHGHYDFVDADVERGEEGMYRVLAVNAIGAGPPTGVVEVQGVSSGRVGGGIYPPGDLAYEVIEGGIRVFWGSTGEGDLYQVQIWNVGDGEWTPFDEGNLLNARSAIVECCLQDNPVPEWLRVRTVRVKGPETRKESSWSDPVSVDMEGGSSLGLQPPVAVDAGQEPGLILLNWEPVAIAEGYQVQQRVVGELVQDWEWVDHGGNGLVSVNRLLVPCCYEAQRYVFDFRLRSVVVGWDGVSQYSAWGNPISVEADYRAPAVGEVSGRDGDPDFVGKGIPSFERAATRERDAGLGDEDGASSADLVEIGNVSMLPGGSLVDGSLENQSLEVVGMSLKGMAGFGLIALSAMGGGFVVYLYFRRREEIEL